MEAATKKTNELDPKAQEWLDYHKVRYLSHKERSKYTLMVKEDALAKIDLILKENDNHSVDDFKFLFDALEFIDTCH